MKDYVLLEDKQSTWHPPQNNSAANLFRGEYN